MSDQIEQLRTELLTVTDPAERLRRIVEARQTIDALEGKFLALRAEEIRRARQDGALSWATISEIFGVTRQRAETMSKYQQQKETATP